MSTFAKFLIAKWKAKPPTWDTTCEIAGVKAVEGRWYSVQTGGDPPTVEIDWDELQAEIAAFEAEFRGRK